MAVIKTTRLQNLIKRCPNPVGDHPLDLVRGQSPSLGRSLGDASDQGARDVIAIAPTVLDGMTGRQAFADFVEQYARKKALAAGLVKEREGFFTAVID